MLLIGGESRGAAGEPFREAEALNSLGETLLGCSDLGQARTQHQEALALAGQAGACYELARAHEGLARVYEASADDLGGA